MAVTSPIFLVPHRAHTPSPGTISNCYIRVVAYGTGIYTGEVISEPTAQVAAGSIMAISEIIGTTMVGETLTAGVVTPAGATVTTSGKDRRIT